MRVTEVCKKVFCILSPLIFLIITVQFTFNDTVANPISKIGFLHKVAIPATAALMQFFFHLTHPRLPPPSPNPLCPS